MGPSNRLDGVVSSRAAAARRSTTRGSDEHSRWMDDCSVWPRRAVGVRLACVASVQHHESRRDAAVGPAHPTARRQRLGVRRGARRPSHWRRVVSRLLPSRCAVAAAGRRSVWWRRAAVQRTGAARHNVVLANKRRCGHAFGLVARRGSILSFVQGVSVFQLHAFHRTTTRMF